MQLLIILSIGLIATVSFSMPGAKKIKDCAGKSNEAVCVGLILNRKINKLMRKTGNAGPVNVIFFDERNCTSQLSSGMIRPSNAQAACKTLVNRTSSYENVDGISVDGVCIDIENSNSYTIQGLTDICAGNI